MPLEICSSGIFVSELVIFILACFRVKACMVLGESMHGLGEKYVWFLEIHAWILGKHGGRLG